MFGTICAVLVVGMNYRFSVAVGVESVPEFLQLRPQLQVVVDLAVENNPGAAVLVVNWLLTPGKIDNREPAHAQADGPVDVESVVIRTAMPDGIAHAPQQRFIDALTLAIYNSYNSTHVFLTILFARWGARLPAEPGGSCDAGRKRIRIQHFPSLSLLTLFRHQHITNRYENKVKDEQL